MTLSVNNIAARGVLLVIHMRCCNVAKLLHSAVKVLHSFAIAVKLTQQRYCIEVVAILHTFKRVVFKRVLHLCKHCLRLRLRVSCYAVLQFIHVVCTLLFVAYKYCIAQCVVQCKHKMHLHCIFFMCYTVTKYTLPSPASASRTCKLKCCASTCVAISVLSVP